MHNGVEESTAMPVTWTLDHAVVVIAVIGGYTTAEMTGAIEAALRDPRVGPGTPVLFDARSSLVYLSPDEIQWRTEWFAAVHRAGMLGRWAFLSTDPYRARIVARGVEGMQRRGIAVAAFTDREAAMRWLMEE
jgi:hypothetical protein